MSTEENKAIVRRFVDEYCNGTNVSLADEIFDARCTMYHPATPEPMRGVAGLKAYATMLFQAFPDFHMDVEDMIVEGDKVTLRSTISGTFKGEFAGLAPTGKHATWSGIGIYSIAGGKIVEGWEELDLLGAFQRLGVIPPMGEGGE